MIDFIISWMQSLPAVVVWIMFVPVAFGLILLSLRLFGQAGLYIYIVLAIIAANIQVQKLVLLGFSPQPVALGTVLFSSSYLATDILAEYYGTRAARRGVWLGFFASLVWTLVMLVTIGFAPLTAEQAGDAYAWALPVHAHISALFTPFPQFLCASLIAYIISQNLDVWLFQRLRTVQGGKHLWLRNNVSTMVSGLVDNIVFSCLAFWLLSSDPVPFQALVFSFILGTYGIRVLVALLDTPIIYAARYCVPPAERNGNVH